jgi:hypothetical protein
MEIGNALSRASNLISITCNNFKSWQARSVPTSQSVLNILASIVNAFLSKNDYRDSKDFKWENWFKLKRISVTYRTWEIASHYNKPGKGVKKAEKFENRGRAVFYRDITVIPNMNVGYDESFLWVKKAAKAAD